MTANWVTLPHVCITYSVMSSVYIKQVLMFHCRLSVIIFFFFVICCTVLLTIQSTIRNPIYFKWFFINKVGLQLVFLTSDINFQFGFKPGFKSGNELLPHVISKIYFLFIVYDCFLSIKIKDRETWRQTETHRGREKKMKLK